MGTSLLLLRKTFLCLSNSHQFSPSLLQLAINVCFFCFLVPHQSFLSNFFAFDLHVRPYYSFGTTLVMCFYNAIWLSSTFSSTSLDPFIISIYHILKCLYNLKNILNHLLQTPLASHLKYFDLLRCKSHYTYVITLPSFFKGIEVIFLTSFITDTIFLQQSWLTPTSSCEGLPNKTSKHFFGSCFDKVYTCKMLLSYLSKRLRSN